MDKKRSLRIILQLSQTLKALCILPLEMKNIDAFHGENMKLNCDNHNGCGCSKDDLAVTLW